MAGSFLLRQRKFRQIFDREERRYRKHAYENAATPSVLPPMFHRTASRLPLVLGSRKRFCEAKDFLGKGRESAFLAKPRCGFDRFQAWKRRIVRVVSGFPRRCEADAWEEEQRGHYRARKAGVKSAAAAVRRPLAYAPCGDAEPRFDRSGAPRECSRGAPLIFIAGRMPLFAQKKG